MRASVSRSERCETQEAGSSEPDVEYKTRVPTPKMRKRSRQPLGQKPNVSDHGAGDVSERTTQRNGTAGPEKRGIGPSPGGTGTRGQETDTARCWREAEAGRTRGPPRSRGTDGLTGRIRELKQNAPFPKKSKRTEEKIEIPIVI